MFSTLPGSYSIVAMYPTYLVCNTGVSAFSEYISI